METHSKQLEVYGNNGKRARLDFDEETENSSDNKRVKKVEAKSDGAAGYYGAFIQAIQYFSEEVRIYNEIEAKYLDLEKNRLEFLKERLALKNKKLETKIYGMNVKMFLTLSKIESREPSEEKMYHDIMQYFLKELK